MMQGKRNYVVLGEEVVQRDTLGLECGDCRALSRHTATQRSCLQRGRICVHKKYLVDAYQLTLLSFCTENLATLQIKCG